ncbi:MAG TPA: hypothetical protein VG142_15055 [Trebonia sp.]|nr:hypothetical protein [Trebonia sp.]
MTGTDRATAIAESFARRQRFEAAHPDVTIMLPPRPTDRWLAVVPLDRAPEGSAGTLGAWNLEELMDELEDIYQDADTPAGRQGTAGTSPEQEGSS